MPNDLVKVEAIRDLNIPGQKTKKIGAPLELPEATVKILEAGENPSVKRVKVESVASTTAIKIINGEQK